ncbi:MAG: AsmA family protein [Proteobacteria bacterium]|nr:AsmA family protein [Pseudomonadota bacterium]
MHGRSRQDDADLPRRFLEREPEPAQYEEEYFEPVRPRRGVRPLAIACLAIFVLLVGLGIVLASITPPVDLVRSRLIAEVERQTGRKLAIASARIDIFGGLAMSMGGFALSAPKDMGGQPLITAERVDAKLALLPLLVREIQIENLTLVKPVLDLRVDRQGRRSWDFASLDVPASRPRYAQAAGGTASDAGLPSELKDFVRNAGAPPGGGAAAVALDGVAFADVRIVGGRIRYDDAREGRRYELDGIDAALSMPVVGGPLTVKGHVVVEGERIAVDGRVEQLRELLAQRLVGVRLELNGKPVKALYEGRLAAGPSPAGEGRLSLSAPSVSALVRLGDGRAGEVAGDGAVAFDGQVKVLPTSVSVTGGSFTLGGSSGGGTLNVDLGGERPKAQANLHVARLDFDQVMTLGNSLASAAMRPSPGGSARPAAIGAAPAAVPDAGRSPPRSIDDLIEQSAPPDAVEAPAARNPARVRGFLQRAGNRWETEAIDARVLGRFDVEARLQVAALHSAKLDGRGLNGSVDLKGGVLRLNVTDGEVAGGKVRGLVSVDARTGTLVFGANVSGDGVQMRPVLAAAGIEAIEGRGKMGLTVSAQGGSERELVSTLAGKAEMKVVDGAALGWDVDHVLAGLAQGRIPNGHRQAGARTPFRELSATFIIASGVARTKDIKLDSAQFLASGTGTINMVDRNLDLMLKPKVAASGLEVPVRIAGSWDDPSVVADVNAAMKSPQAQEAVRQLKNGDVEGALRSVLGNDAAAKQKIDKAKEALRGLLER